MQSRRLALLKGEIELAVQRISDANELYKETIGMTEYEEQLNPKKTSQIGQDLGSKKADPVTFIHPRVS